MDFNEELPQMDGTCDACEPDEARCAAQFCPLCHFSFCESHALQHCHQLQPYPEPRAEEPGAAAAAAVDTVMVKRLRCKEHNQEGSLYCKSDQRIVCVLCAVQGSHREHQIITLHEAYLWQKSKEGIDLLSRTQEISENIEAKRLSADMSVEELERFVNQQYDELHRLVRMEERRILHLVDLKEAFLTAQAAEKITEINIDTEKLQEEMDAITQQLNELDQVEKNGPVPASLLALANPDLRLRAANQRRDEGGARDEDRDETHDTHAP